LGGITAQMVQRKDAALPLVVMALDCRQHELQAVWQAESL
jgi:hypothetical protein